MGTKTKVWLMIAAFLVLIGCILFAGVMWTLGWDFTKLATVQYETKTYEVSEAFDSISVNTDTADIVFAFSNDGKCKVVCYEEENAKHTVSVEDGTLAVALMDERSAADYIRYVGINIGAPRITVYLPETQYTSLLIYGDTADAVIPKGFMFKDAAVSLRTGDVDFFASASEKLQIKTSTGDIRIEEIYAGELDLSVSTGEIYLTDVTCSSIVSQGSTGDISLDHVIATGKISIQRSTGDIRLDGTDAAEIFVQTDTGDVTGTLLTEKVFAAKTDTGDVDVPKTATGGKCEIITNTGDIQIKVA